MSLLTSFTRPVGGAQFEDRVEPFPWLLMGSTKTAAWIADALYLYRFRVSRPFSFTKISLSVGATVADTVDVAVLTNPSGDLRNFSRMVSSGPLTPGTSQEAQFAMTATGIVVPFIDYWLGFATHNATLTVLRVATDATSCLVGARGVVKSSVWSSGIPTSVDMGSPLTGVGAMPAFALIA